ncbi:MAG: DUF563 domain-containing protein [Magnetococcales bacterium]|nr:DUF563 domain-containing protein [Magnetococcales bacterium]
MWDAACTRNPGGSKGSLMRNDSEVIKKILILDANNDVKNLQVYVLKQSHDPQLLYTALCILLHRGRLASVGALAIPLFSTGYRDAISSLSLAIGGICYSFKKLIDNGTGMLHLVSEQLTESTRREIYDFYVVPAMMSALQSALDRGDRVWVAQCVEILRVYLPHFSEIFPDPASWGPPLASPSIEEMCRRGREQTHLRIGFLPLDMALYKQRHVIVATKGYVSRGQTWPRPLSVEARLVIAMRAYGWDVELCRIPGFDINHDAPVPPIDYPLAFQDDNYCDIIPACRKHGADLLVFDDSLVIESGCTGSLSQPRKEMLNLLRMKMPELKIAVILFNPAELPEQFLREIAGTFDMVLDPTSPALETWKHQEFSHKVMHLPIPQGGGRATLPKLNRTFSSPVFAGSDTSYRFFWYMAARQANLPIRLPQETCFSDDWLRIDEYVRFKQHMSMESCYLFVASGPHKDQPVSDSAFAAIMGGALLIHQASSHMRRFFTPGEHYLEFSTLAELGEIIRFITESPEEAERIRRAGYEFAHEHYSDEKLIGCLDRTLFHSEHGKFDFDSMAQLKWKRLVTFEFISVRKWCQTAPKSMLLSGPGNLVTFFDECNTQQPAISFPGLRAESKEYSDLAACDAKFFSPSVHCIDFRTGRLMPHTPFIARLENVRIFAGADSQILLDRHHVLSEGRHDEGIQKSTMRWTEFIRYYENYDLRVGVVNGVPRSLPIDIKYYLDSEVDRVEEGPSIYIGASGWYNYHHWLCEILPRLWCVTAIPELRSLPLIVCADHAGLRPFQLETLHALGYPPEQIKQVSGNMMHVENMIFPSAITPRNNSLAVVSWLREHLIPGFGLEPVDQANGLLYISRKNATSRRVANEEQLTAQLEKRGFQSVFLERLSVRDQIALFRSAKIVVYPHGAGGTNIIFSQPGTVLIDLMAEIRINSWILNYAYLNNCRYATIICDLYDNDLVVNVDALMKIIDKALRDSSR